MIQVRCNLCGQNSWQVRVPATMGQNGHLDVDAFRCTSPGYGRHAQIVQCQNCGYVYANPRWAGDDLLTAYEAVEDETLVVLEVEVEEVTDADADAVEEADEFEVAEIEI